MRRTTTLTITAEGRDKGKVFVLREMPADQAERWATRALLLLGNAGAEIPDNILQAGWAGLAVMGIQALGNLKFDGVEPLLVEMWACVSWQPPLPNTPLQSIKSGDDCQIEEVATRFQLRKAVLDLHLGFSTAAASPSTGTPPPAPPATA